MSFVIVTLVSSATVGEGTPRVVDQERSLLGPIPIQVTGTFVGTVKLEGTLSEQVEVDGDTALWSVIGGGEWSEPACDALTTAFTHIRANITAISSGTITLKVLV